MVGHGYCVFDTDPRVSQWAKAAHVLACRTAADPNVRQANLRHGETWFVGVDALPNDPDGAVEGVPLDGPWASHVPDVPEWHRAQLSIVFPGYPKQDPDESDAKHRYRVARHAAHVDGLLPIGAERRRFLREPHAFILGLPLNESNASPLMVWPGSHRIMGAALRDAIGDADPTEVDLTAPYQAARRAVFDAIEPVPLFALPGQSILLHRHLLHGVAPWATGQTAPPEGRMIAYFRPQFSAMHWLTDKKTISAVLENRKG